MHDLNSRLNSNVIGIKSWVKNKTFLLLFSMFVGAHTQPFNQLNQTNEHIYHLSQLPRQIWTRKSNYIILQPKKCNAVKRKALVLVYKWSFTRRPSSLKMSLVACSIPVYFDVPYTSLRSNAHEEVGSSWTWMPETDMLLC